MGEEENLELLVKNTNEMRKRLDFINSFNSQKDKSYLWDDEEYAKRMKETGGISMGGGIGAPPSPAAGGY